MLPFGQQIEVQGNPGGESLGTFSGQIWRQDGSASNDRGQRYDATGELEADAAPYLVEEGNRQLVVDGTKFKVVSAVEHEFLPHVSVQLFELRPGG